MAHNLLILIETLAFVYLSFLAGDLVFRLAGRALAAERLRGAYAVMLGAGIFGMMGLLLGLVGSLTPLHLRLFMLVILAASRQTIADHARILWSHASPTALAGLVRPILREHAFFKLLIFFWLAFNFVLAFVPITAHDTKSYHLPIITDLQTQARITFSPEILEYGWMPLMGQIMYAVPTIAFANTTAPFVFQIMQYGALVLLIIIINEFLRDKIRYLFLRFGAILFILAIFDLQREALHGGYTDMFVYLFGITSALLLIEGCCRGRFHSPSITLSAIFLGVALGVKQTALFIAATNYLFLLIGMVKNHAGTKKIISHLAIYSLIVLLIAGFWYARNAIIYEDPLYVGGVELHAGRMAETFVIERTPLNMILFPFYKFGPNERNNSISSSKFIVLGYFILVYTAVAGAVLFARKKIALPEILLFAASHIQLMLIFFQSHHTRYLLPAIIILPIILVLFLDKIYGLINEVMNRGKYRTLIRISRLCLGIVCFIFFIGNIRYFYVRVLYKTGVLNKQEYIKKIGSQ
ncbi:MAG: hypothetical protein WAP52_00675 [Candidatus Sungiibacteriota bacterium]